jgi:hypothetical protein
MNKSRSKKRHTRTIYGRGEKALTPTLAPANDVLEQQVMLAILESRLNGQQKRIADNEVFIKLLKQEHVELRKLVKDIRTAYFQAIAPKPGPPEKK